VDAVVWISVQPPSLTGDRAPRYRLADAIVAAADEILGGRHRDQFVVDVYQPAPRFHNMNVNEVLANRANEILGGKRGVPAIPMTTSIWLRAPTA
jgi:fumarate hydratase class II/aspartate ammonia-lyase